MSRAVLDAILSAMHIWLSEVEREQLYHELVAYFGLIGAVDECQALEYAWQDPYNRREIEDFINAWLSRRRRRREEVLTGVV
ncbi:MAG: hypothetical protein QXR17_06265 [Candidatus Bathyarchaeia archaeon]|nr:hypothetical protein [Candidatus Bathyarchaeota archaeon]